MLWPMSSAGGNVYWPSSVDKKLRVTAVPGVADWSSGTTTTSSSDILQGVFAWCLDTLNSQTFEVDSSNVFKKRDISSGFGSWSSIGFTAASDVIAVACDPTNSRLFYIQKSTASDQVRTVNYDGTGDTAISGWTGTTTTPRFRVVYDKTLDRVYYLKNVDSGGGLQIRYVQADGTGDSSYTSLLAPTDISDLVIDFTNRHLFWMTTSGLGRGNMDGTGITTITFTSGAEGLAFSQLLAKVYHQGSGNDYRRCNPDGTGDELIMSSGGPIGLTKIALGSGLETLGASAIL